MSFDMLIGKISISIASALLAVGLLAPSFTIVPSFGDPVIDGILRELAPDRMLPQSFSIFSGILALFQHGDIALGCLLFLFSVVFPITKAIALVILLFTWREEKSGRRAAIESWSNWVLSRVSAYSMLDVFVIAVIVIGFKEFPLGTRFDYHWGILVFAVAILLSIVAATVFERRQTAWERTHRLPDSA